MNVPLYGCHALWDVVTNQPAEKSSVIWAEPHSRSSAELFGRTLRPNRTFGLSLLGCKKIHCKQCTPLYQRWKKVASTDTCKIWLHSHIPATTCIKVNTLLQLLLFCYKLLYNFGLFPMPYSIIEGPTFDKILIFPIAYGDFQVFQHKIAHFI